MTSGVFVCESDGKPYLIWGENTDTNLQRMPRFGMNEIVIFDPLAKKEILRKPLGDTYSGFQPNLDGTKIYFAKRETGEIFCFDRKTQTINSFAKTGVQDFDGWNGAIIVATN